MKALLLLTVLAQAPVAPATPPQLSRADVHFVIGWQNLRNERAHDEYDDWLNNIFYGGAGAGWYWSDHLKTQVDIGAGTHGRRYRYQARLVNGTQTFETSRADISQRSVAIGQQYQFFRNQWLHPRLGAGLEFARETTDETYDPVFVFDNATRTNRQISPGRNETERRNIVRPFAEAGFKAYMTRRAFFTADSRFMFKSGIDEVLFRFGFGVDF
jgi:hypothetical protein